MEGSFSVLKREHLLSKIRKRGILCAAEECLLVAMALDLKRMVKAIPPLKILELSVLWERVLFVKLLSFSTGP